MRVLLGALALLVAAPAAARTCLGRDADADPPTAAAFRACQEKQRADFVAKARPGGRRLEAFDDAQRSDAGVYFGRHTQTGDEAPSAAEPPPAARAPKRARPIFAAGQGAPDGSVEREAGATPAELDALKAAMLEKADGGKMGLTPEMAADLRAYLLQKQGSVSPEMQALLDSTAKDGANLSQGTMEKLRGAGNAAKGAGLDLGIDPNVEKALLRDDLSPAPGKAPPGAD